MPKMLAAVVTDAGVVVREVDRPVPKPNEVLVRVRAASLNRADLGVAAGHMHGSIGGTGTIPGLEWAGEISALGAEVPGFKPGDRVMCSGSGGYAEYAVTDWGRISPVPDANMSWTQATTLPVALQTMHDALITNGAMAKGDAVLIQGASSGVGLMGMQIARELGAGLVLGGSGNAERRAKLAEYGAHHAIDTSQPNWSEQVLALTGGEGVRVIIDQVSASVANENMKATAIKGRIVNVGRLGGQRGEFNYDLHALRRIQYIGVTFRTRSIAEVREINRLMREDLWEAIEAGRLRLPLDRSFPLTEAAAALDHMKANAHFGKITLIP